MNINNKIMEYDITKLVDLYKRLVVQVKQLEDDEESDIKYDFDQIIKQLKEVEQDMIDLAKECDININEANKEPQEYCIINTGYTSRIVSRLFDKPIKKDDYWVLENPNISNLDKHINLDKEVLDEFYNNLIYIKDSLWGKGEYHYRNEETINTIKKLMAHHSKWYDNGIVVIKGDSSDGVGVVEFLRKLHYCGMYNLEKITTKEHDNITLTYISVDCESG